MADGFAIGKALEIPDSVLKNIEQIDKKINDISKDSELMAQHFGSAMIRMGNGSDTLLKKLQQIQALMGNMGNVNISGVSNLEGIFTKFTSEAEKAISTINGVASALNKMGKVNVTREKLVDSKDIDLLNKEITALKKKTETLEKLVEKSKEQRKQESGQSAQTRTNNKAIDAYNRAMASSEALITQRINKIAKLRQAEEMLSKASGNYSAQITRIRQEIERLNKLNEGQVDAYGRIIKSQSNLMNTSEQLMRKLALIFSVSQIQGYILNMRNVTAEFEKQNVALASILQNKDQADKLFGRITELAVKSPFTLKELITYTKSLSAYQVEYEKLYDTTKRLADVSAGLGVDMQRLILAFGQVKASNFLRGTEVRQFTEAGFNILGELAKYYSELEGRMISVGDVQERVTKRMVAFGDVEEVFRRVTSAGGMFYQMQERQAETLAGQISNLNDSLDLMLNDIGQANMGALKGFIEAIRNIIKNWREVVFVLEPAVYLLGAYKTATILASVANSGFAKSLTSVTASSGGAVARLRLLANSMNFLKNVAKGLGITLAGLIPTLLIGWLLDVYRQSTKASRELERLYESLDKLVNTDYGNLEKTTKALDDLISRYKLSNEGSQERRDIISSLNSNYGQYLDFVVEETTSLEKLTSAYDDVIKRMKERAALQTLEKGYQQINQSYEESLTEARKAFEDELRRGLSVDLGRGFKKSLIPTEEDINNLYNIIQQKVRETDSELLEGSREQRNLFQEIVQNYYGKDITISQDYLKTIPLIDAFIRKKESEERLERNINSTFKDTLKSREAYLALQERENRLAKEKKDIQNQNLSPYETQKKLSEAIEKFELDVVDIKLRFGEISDAEAKRAKDRIVNWATDTVRTINEQLKSGLAGFSEEDIAKALITPEEQKTGQTAIEKTTIQNWQAQNEIIQQQTRLKNEGLAADEKLLANAIKMEEIYRIKAGILGLELDYQEKINKATLESINERLPEKYQLDLLDALKSQAVLLEEANKKYTDTEAKLKQINAQKAIGVVIDEEARKGLEEDLKNYDLLRKLLGYTEKEKKTRTRDTTAQTFKEQLSFFQKANKEYESLLKNYNEEAAKLKLIDALKEEAAQKKVSEIFMSAEFDEKGTLASLEKVKAMYKNMSQEMRIAFAEAFGSIQLEMDIDVRQDKIKKIQDDFSQMFGSYELSVELDKLGLDKEQLSRLFDIDITSLPELDEWVKSYKEDLLNRKKYGEEGVEIYKKMENQITEIQNKEMLERTKKYAEYLKKSIPERLKIEQDYQKQLQEVASDTKYTKAEREKINAALKKERDEAINKLDWDEFKNSDLYASLFQDLQYVSTAALRKMRQGLEDVQKSFNQLNPEQLKVLMDLFNKIDEIEIKRNPFKYLLSSDVKEASMAWQEMGNIMSEISSAASDIASSLENVFGTMDDKTADIVSSFSEIANGIGNTASGVGRMMAGDWIGGGLQALTGLASTIGSIFAIGDKKKEREIQRQIELVENLQRSYEKLEQAIEDAYSLDTLKESTDKTIQNLKEQNAAYEKAIAAEMDKKKTDDDRVKEWQNAIQENNDRINELLEESVSTATSGILDSLLSAASDFTDAWLESFREIGNGMQGLEQNFQEMLENMVKQQATMLITNQFLEDWKKQLSNYINADDLELTSEEAKKWVDAVKEDLPALNEALENYFKAMGEAGLDLGQGGDTMSELQKGIQSVSEETAQALEALLSSVRYFTSDSNTVLHNIYNSIAMPTAENPFLAEMKVQSSYLSNLNALVGSVVKTSSGKGKVLRVELA